LIIFDTTLRDGEQSPGASMTRDEKVRIAKALERMRVDVIEAGLPHRQPGDFEAVQAVARAVKDSTVCGLARALDKDIDRAGEALKDANSAHPYLHRHLAHPHEDEAAHGAGPGGGTGGARGQARAPVHRQRGVLAEDAGRSDLDFLCRVLEAVISAGAARSTFPIPWATTCRTSSAT
jgi:2-isopropylmalate synthase